MTIALDTVERRASGPFKFLDFYEEQDRPKFAGRERDIREVAARICANRTFVLYAQSGLGKTSLLLAGVFPLLRERRFTPVYIRTLEDPTQDLCAAVAAELKTDPIETFDELASVLEAHSTHTTVVLVFDQFEEFFIHFRHHPRQRAAFVSSIATLADMTSLNVRLVFSLREDYLAELDEFRDEVSDLFANDYRLRRLSAFGARQAIAQPLIVAEVPYDRRLLVRMVDLLAEVGFDPVMLQILCTEVYRLAAARATGDARLTESDLERAGGLEGVVRRYLDRVVSTIPHGSVLLSRTVLDAMITQEKTKRAVTFDTLVNADFSASRDELERVLQIFITHRLVRAEQRGQQEWYELSHERLVGPVLDWLKLDQDFFNFRVARDLVANSCSGEVWRHKIETLLAGGPLIHVIGPYAMRLRFSPLELEFVYRSAVYRGIDTTYWASLIGREACTAILLEYLRSDTAQARSSAAAAAAASPEPASVLADACLELAMSDPDVSVRRAAGRALGTLATDGDLEKIAAAVGSRQTRAAALEVAADLRQQGRALHRFSRWSRLRARYIANRRVRRQHAEAIRDRGKQGALTGLLTSIAWTGAVLFPVVVIATVVTGFRLTLGVLGSTALALVPALALGALIGWRTGRAAAVDAAHHGEGGWFRAIMRLRFQYWPMALFAMTLPMSLLESMMPALWYSGIFLGTALSAQLIIAVTAWTARAAVWPGVAPRHVWLWSLGASAGLPLLVGGLTLWTIAAAGESTDGWDVMVASFTAAVSLAAAVAINTLSRAPVAAVEHPRPSVRLTSQSRIVLLVSAVLAWSALTYGWDSSLFGARTVRVDTAAIDVVAPLRPRLNDSAYFRVETARPGPLWLRVIDTPESSEAVVGDEKLSSGALIAFPTGGGRLVVRGEVDGEATQTLRLEPVRAANGSTIALQAPYEMSVVLVRFTPSGQPGVWTASVQGTTGERRAPAARVHVSVFGVSDDQGLPRVFVQPASGARSAEGTASPSSVHLPASAAVIPDSSAGNLITVPVADDGRWGVPLELRAAAPGVLSGRTSIDLPLRFIWTQP